MSTLIIFAFLKAIPPLAELFSQIEHGPLLLVIVIQSIIIMMMSHSSKQTGK